MVAVGEQPAVAEILEPNELYVQRLLDWRQEKGRLQQEKKDYDYDASRLTVFINGSYNEDSKESRRMHIDSFYAAVDSNDYKTLFLRLKAECTRSSIVASASENHTLIRSRKQDGAPANGKFQVYLTNFQSAIRELEVWGRDYVLPDLMYASELAAGVNQVMFENILKDYNDAGRIWSFAELRDKFVTKYAGAHRDNERTAMSAKLGKGGIDPQVKAYNAYVPPPEKAQ